MAIRSPSRPARMNAILERLRDAKTDLEALMGEYQDWFDEMPENLQEGPTGVKLQAVIDDDPTDALQDVIDVLEGLELPRGFGKD